MFVGESLFSFEFLVTSMLWLWKGSLMKMQTRILDNRFYDTRMIELHRKGKKSRTVRIKTILMCGTRPFFGRSGRRAGAHTPLAFPKMPTTPSAFPLLGAPQVPGNIHLPNWVKAWGKGPLRLKKISSYRDTLGQIRAADNMAGRIATRQLERRRPILICLSGSEISQY